MSIPKIFVLFASLVWLSAPAFAQSPGDGSFTYQGELRDQGAPITGSVDMRLSLYTAEVGGSLVSSAVQLNDVDVQNGIFTVQISFGTSAFDGSPRWLWIEVRNPHDPRNTAPFVALNPRQAVSATPYAQHAQFAEDSAHWGRLGVTLTNENTDRVFINRNTAATTNEYFGVHAPVTSGYGGMYVTTGGGNTQPFYGYQTPTKSAWTYLNGFSGNWNLWLNNGNRFTVAPDGNIGIGTTTPAQKLDVVGAIRSQSGGFHFPDGTVQTTAAAGGVAFDGHSLDASDGLPVDALSVDTLGRVSTVDDLGVGRSPTVRLHVAESNQTTNVASIERTADGTISSDILELKTGAGSSPDIQFIEAEVGSNLVFRLWGDGDVSMDGVLTTGGADFAELVAATTSVDELEPGDVIVIDPEATRGFRKSNTAASRLVAGIYSTKPGMLGTTTDWDALETIDADGEGIARKTLAAGRDVGEFPMAIVGIVPCKVSDEGGPIRAGDLLVSSSTPGHAMRADDPKVGTVVGKALGDLTGGRGTIEVLVGLQ